MNICKKILLITLSAYCISQPLYSMAQTKEAIAKTRELQKKLLEAIKKNDCAAIKEALAAGADINKEWEDEYDSPCTISKLAIDCDLDLATLQRVLTFPGIIINRPDNLHAIRILVQEAASSGNSIGQNLTTLEILLKNHLDVHSPAFYTYLKSEPTFGDTLLHTALRTIEYTRGSQESVIQLLLSYGADPLIKNDRGATALDIAQEQLPHFIKIIKEGRAAYIKAKQKLLQESKTAATTAGERGLPGGVADIIAEYAVGDEDVEQHIRAECAREEVKGSQSEVKKKSDSGN